MNEITKTSLLVIATIFTGVGGGMLAADFPKGVWCLLIAVGILVLRGYLKQKGIEVERR